MYDYVCILKRSRYYNRISRAAIVVRLEAAAGGDAQFTFLGRCEPWRRNIL